MSWRRRFDDRPEVGAEEIVEQLLHHLEVEAPHEPISTAHEVGAHPLTDTDIESGSHDCRDRGRDKWVEYSKAKDEMMLHTHTPEAPWYTVEADDKKTARLTCISHLLDSIEYKDVLPGAIELPKRPPVKDDYVRPPRDENTVLLALDR